MKEISRETKDLVYKVYFVEDNSQAFTSNKLNIPKTKLQHIINSIREDTSYITEGIKFNSRYNKETRDLLLKRRYEDGLSLVELQNEFGIKSINSINNILMSDPRYVKNKNKGLYQQPRVNLSENKISDIIKLHYYEGLSIIDINERLGVSNHSVIKVLRDYKCSNENLIINSSMSACLALGNGIMLNLSERQFKSVIEALGLHNLEDKSIECYSDEVLSKKK